MEAARQPVGSIGVGDVVGETFSIYGRHAAVLIGSAAAVFVVIGLVSGLLENSGGFVFTVLAAIVRLIGYAVYVGFVVGLVEDVRDGRRDRTVRDLFDSAAPVILPLIVFGLLFAVGVTIGLVLLVIPGLVLLTIWSVGAPAIVIERVEALDAFGRSRRLVRGQAWQVFLVLLVVLIIVLAIQFVFAAIANPIGNGDVATLIAAIVSTALTAPIFAIAAGVLFFELGGGAAKVVSPEAQA